MYVIQPVMLCSPSYHQKCGKAGEGRYRKCVNRESVLHHNLRWWVLVLPDRECIDTSTSEYADHRLHAPEEEHVFNGHHHIRAVRGPLDDLRVDTVHGFHAFLDQLGRLEARDTTVAAFQTFHAVIHGSVDEKSKVQQRAGTGGDVFKAVRVVQQVKAFADHHLVLVADELVLVGTGVAFGVTKPGQGNASFLTVADTAQVFYHAFGIKRIRSPATPQEILPVRFLGELLARVVIPVHGEDEAPQIVQGGAQLLGGDILGGPGNTRHPNQERMLRPVLEGLTNALFNVFEPSGRGVARRTGIRKISRVAAKLDNGQILDRRRGGVGRCRGAVGEARVQFHGLLILFDPSCQESLGKYFVSFGKGLRTY